MGSSVRPDLQGRARIETCQYTDEDAHVALVRQLAPAVRHPVTGPWTAPSSRTDVLHIEGNPLPAGCTPAPDTPQDGWQS
ncbi:hypothetical protein K353_06557 [Kitasatospora sp. SolWspMP-SS2h]|uniref:hypothetical protein n=1 Tax=Kitasatospora sp. SolWspMP-SS2h TaxID=1305729 RepID=UPI000DB9DA9D|nr:hypothetical protein [Kitasatospora sp. SolWspMP-SS2h]RAJ29853.1 hypothetical protein K353_06557 [Kitasatospora sp. SolWspMP-SS2h]